MHHLCVLACPCVVEVLLLARHECPFAFHDRTLHMSVNVGVVEFDRPSITSVVGVVLSCLFPLVFLFSLQCGCIACMSAYDTWMNPAYQFRG